MEGNFFNNFLSKLKKNFNKDKKNNYPQFSEYSFSGEEIEILTKQNIDEINKLRNGYKKKEEVKKDKKIIEDKNNIIFEDNLLDDRDISLNNIDNKNNKDNEVNKDIKDNRDNEGYINLSLDKKENIMKRWNSIDAIRLSRDIDKGKDILDHNYIITYADNALEFIYRIRDEYDILIEYLIGFNNEKKGILNKNIFSDKLDNEWKYLKNYIRVLEKIKSAIDR